MFSQYFRVEYWCAENEWALFGPLIQASMPLEQVPITVASLKQSSPSREITLSQLNLNWEKGRSNAVEEEPTVEASDEMSDYAQWLRYCPYLITDRPVLSVYLFSAASSKTLPTPFYDRPLRLGRTT
ncbi:hypothetical protein GNI_089690 [Gregarina niphandrodes]|uniref:Uncharacterized protein n=1 Tax=Gregarina niphandrodes TaxID=110365 RepID=A0A023B5K3_GRENI|nr:hypothetical protein GNI_089690 [Gregarina niphandrodes]EZG61008.1 hypothetical protein GNI_089690 [Gregarina niphandrodes]|eukprot:XP_011130810.1 hypothetical protein GNI_089690 [Gregarina niphandrodes]